jgi:ATP/ADP translocase
VVAAIRAIIITDTAVANRKVKANIPRKTKKQPSKQPKKTIIMHRKSRFLVALAIAAITFGTLWLTLGSDQFNRGHRLCEHEHCCTQSQVDCPKK